MVLWKIKIAKCIKITYLPEIAVLEKQKKAVEKEKAELQNEVELLNDEDYVARYARENYIFSRDGEQVSIIPGVE